MSREHNPALIRLVSARYNELQGLRTMAEAGMVLAFGGVLRGSKAMDEGNIAVGWPTLLAVTALCGFSLYCCAGPRGRWLDRYSGSRYGRVGPRTFRMTA